MGRMTTAQRVDRVMRLLVGLRRRPIALALVQHGFGAADIDEGFAHLRAVTVSSLEPLAKVSTAPTNFDQLEAWSKHWQPILEPAVQRHHPQLAQRLFRPFLHDSPVHTRAYATGRMFHDTIVELRAEAETDQTRALFALLAKKGLGERELAHLAGLVEQDAPKPGAEWPGVDFTAAEQRLWDWYVEWSAVLRARLRDKRLRRELGISDTQQEEPES